MDNGEWTEGESTDDDGVRGGWVRKKMSRKEGGESEGEGRSEKERG